MEHFLFVIPKDFRAITVVRILGSRNGYITLDAFRRPVATMSDKDCDPRKIAELSKEILDEMLAYEKMLDDKEARTYN